MDKYDRGHGQKAAHGARGHSARQGRVLDAEGGGGGVRAPGEKRCGRGAAGCAASPKGGGLWPFRVSRAGTDSDIA